jgi:ActR/RegA family two-component response regulator
MSQGQLLIVDDDDAVRKSLLRFLEDADYQVYAAASDEQAIAFLSSNHTDLAMVDMRLAGNSGETLILKANAIQPHLRFLVYTGSNTFEVTPAMHGVGIRPEHVLRKPVESLRVIQHAIDDLFEEIREGQA